MYWATTNYQSLFFFFLNVIVFQVHLSPFPPLWLCPCVLYTFFLRIPPLISPLSSPLSPLVTIRLFFSSMSLVLFCSLVCFADQVLLISDIIWYLSLTAWLVSLSIMLSKSTHAVAKGRSSFFLSAACIPLCKCTIVFWSTHLQMSIQVAFWPSNSTDGITPLEVWNTNSKEPMHPYVHSSTIYNSQELL